MEHAPQADLMCMKVGVIMWGGVGACCSMHGACSIGLTKHCIWSFIVEPDVSAVQYACSAVPAVAAAR